MIKIVKKIILQVLEHFKFVFVFPFFEYPLMYCFKKILNYNSNDQGHICGKFAPMLYRQRLHHNKRQETNWNEYKKNPQNLVAQTTLNT